MDQQDKGEQKREREEELREEENLEQGERHGEDRPRFVMELREEDEFGPEAFEDEEENKQTHQRDTVAAGSEPVRVKQSPLPWFLFAVSVVALGVMFFLGNKGMSGTAATVNGDKVTKEELYQAMFDQGGTATLDMLIQDKLVDQEAAKKKIAISDQDVETELQDIKKNFPDEEQFKAALEQNNLTLDQLKDQIRSNLKVTKVFEGQMDLSDAKLKEYFDTNKDRYGSPEQIDVSHILVDKKEDADKILADLKGGADFAAIAKEKSVDPGSKDQGGSLGLIARGQGLDQTFEDAAFKLEKGQMSGVVQTEFGYHIIKVNDKVAAVTPNYDTAKDKVKKDMVQEEVSGKAGEWLEGLKTNAKIEKNV